jgi:hypothetical protein
MEAFERHWESLSKIVSSLWIVLQAPLAPQKEKFALTGSLGEPGADPLEVHIYRRGKFDGYGDALQIHESLPLARRPRDRILFANTDSIGPVPTIPTAISGHPSRDGRHNRRCNAELMPYGGKKSLFDPVVVSGANQSPSPSRSPACRALFLGWETLMPSLSGNAPHGSFVRATLPNGRGSVTNSELWKR